MAEKLYQNETWLREEYLIKRKSISRICAENGFGTKTIPRWLKKFQIPIRPMREYVTKQIDEKWLIDQYVNQKRSASSMCHVMTNSHRWRWFALLRDYWIYEHIDFDNSGWINDHLVL